MTGETYRILLAEDDRFLRKAAETTLKRNGLEVTTATDGEEALRAVGTCNPHLVLLDLIMPKVQGFEVLRSIKADPATAAIPVIVLSNLGQERDVQRAMEGGAVAYRIKANLSLDDLVKQVKQVLGLEAAPVPAAAAEEPRVGELGLVDEAEFERARLMATRLKMPLERAVAERGRFPFAFLLEQLAQAWGVGFIDLKVSDVHLEALKTIRDEYAKSHVVIPFEQAGRQLKVAMVNPRDRVLIKDMEQMTRLEVVPFLAPEGSIRRAQLLYKGNLRDLLERSTIQPSTEVKRPLGAGGPGLPGKQWTGSMGGAGRAQWG